MHLTTQGSSPLQTIFGGGYVVEQRGDETHRNLPSSDDGKFVVDFAGILKALRSALSLG
jgi:hypothetical protein